MPKSIPEALKRYRATAASGSADAMFSLAVEHGNERARVSLRESKK